MPKLPPAASDPSAEFPPPFMPGEYGRAWLDSLYWNDRAAYDDLLRSGNLPFRVEQTEAEGQQEYRSILRANTSRPLPKECVGDPLKALAWAGQLRDEARETVMENLRVPPPMVGEGDH